MMKHSLGAGQQTYDGGAPSYPTTQPASLSVSDIERLAKAGVQMKFEDIYQQVHPDIEPKQYTISNHLAKPLIERWAASKVGEDRLDRYLIYPFSAFVQRFKDTFYIFVSTPNGPPCIIEDDAHLYPSDALMAKIHLMLEVQPKGGSNDQGEQVTQGGADRWGGAAARAVSTFPQSPRAG